MTPLPPMKIAQGEPYAYDFTVQGQDWTGWTGTATFKRAPQAETRSNVWFDDAVEPILTVDVVLDALGVVQMALTAAQTATFPAFPKLGFYRTAVCEFSMTDGTDVQKFQNRVLTGTRV